MYFDESDKGGYYCLCDCVFTQQSGLQQSGLTNHTQSCQQTLAENSELLVQARDLWEKKQQQLKRQRSKLEHQSEISGNVPSTAIPNAAPLSGQPPIIVSRQLFRNNIPYS